MEPETRLAARVLNAYVSFNANLKWDHPAMADNPLPYFRYSRCREEGRPGKNLTMSLHLDTRMESAKHDDPGPPDM